MSRLEVADTPGRLRDRYSSAMFTCVAVRIIFFFFFQAEDGIRDLIVTGVQTCALPISPGPAHAHGAVAGAVHLRGGAPHVARRRGRRPSAGRLPGRPAARVRRSRPARSEEHTSELQSRSDLVCRLLLEKKKKAESLSCC